MSESSTVALADGREIGVAEYGDPQGAPCVYLHGAGSSRLEAAASDEAARRRHVRLVALDRSGYGRSSAGRGDSLASLAHDVAEVTRAIGLEPAAVVGVSAGGPYALACAALHPERFTVVVLVNTTAPGDDREAVRDYRRTERLAILLVRRLPRLLRWLLGLRWLRLVGDPGRLREEGFRRRAGARLVASDRMLLERPELREVFVRSLEESAAEWRYRVVLDDLHAIWGVAWGFDPYGLRVPLEIFVGREDRSSGFAEKLVARNASGRVHRVEGGHLSFLEPAVTDAVMAAVAARSPHRT